MAHKLARLIYIMMTFGTEYVDKGMAAYESRYRQHQMKMALQTSHFTALCLVSCRSFASTVQKINRLILL
jgi:hypothetical protein